MSCREFLSNNNKPLYFACALTVLVLGESMAAPYSPFFPLYALLALVIPLLAKTNRWDFSVFTKQARFLLAATGIYLCWEILAGTVLYAKLIAALGLDHSPFYSLGAALTELLQKASRSLSLSTDITYLIYAGFYLVWAPVGEEWFYRGYLLTSLGERMSPVKAALLSSCLFGLRHAAHLFYLWPNVPYVAALTWVAMAFGSGMILCWIYHKTKSLWPVVLLHFTGNLAGLLLG